MKNNKAAYKDGMGTGLKDWCITGVPHRTSICPYKKDKDVINWWLGRSHGFQEAEKLIEKRSN